MDQSATHGPLSCAKCFADCDVPEKKNGWQLVNDPGYWGAADPVVLVLGQSKGNNARQVYAQGGPAFDAVAFAGIRDRLAEILDRLGIQLDKSKVDKHFTSAETEIAFASLLRCSLSDPAGKTSGNPIVAAMDDPEANKWVEDCMRTWLSRLNPRLKLVVLFGLSDGYATRVAERLEKLHASTFRKIKNAEKMAVEAAGVTWVFAQHPSRISENHYRRWISHEPHEKRDAIRAVVGRILESTTAF